MRRRIQTYLFRDDFESGIIQPSKWAVTDTENKISVAGGKLIFAGGKAIPASGDPRIVSVKALARVAGMTLTARFTPNQTNKFAWPIAFSRISTPTNLPYNPGIYLEDIGEMFTSNNDGFLKGNGFSYLANQPYYIRLVLKVAGYLAYASADGKIYTLLWEESSETYTPLYVALVNFNAAFNCDYIRVVKTVVKPPILQDSFTRANGALGTADVGGSWYDYGTWSIAANKAKTDPGLGIEQSSGHIYVNIWYQITATQADHFYVGCAIGDVFRASAATLLDANNKVRAILDDLRFQAVINSTKASINGIADAAWTVAAGKQAGLTVRSDAIGTALFAYVNRVDGKAYLDKDDGGVYSNLLSGAITYGADKVIRLIVNGTSARLYYDGLEVGTGATVPSSTDNVHGLFSTDPGNSCSSFKWQE